ncbi:hypothetical protein N9250_00275 [bacterium]|nr:hypothetical protein [Rubripirellula sp.]MDA7874619.1 hypothetical protein [Rhodopirellula sp.]MDB4540098.1 hypothetical protein [bacterium]MDB4644947.1 hypothetical protein [Rubripirellula sp.]
MRISLFAGSCLLAASSCFAADVSEFGLGGIEPLSDREAQAVRGAGGDTIVQSISTNSMAFSIVDKDSGSVFNMNATSQLIGKDSVTFDTADSGLQAVGNSSTGGVQFGDAEFNMGEFFFSMSGFSSIGQAQQIGGAGKMLDFSSLLP